MLVPQAFLAALCLGVGLFPGAVLGTLGTVLASLPGLQPAAGVPPVLSIDVGPANFDRVAPAALGLTIAAGLLGAATVATARRARRVPTWGCGGQLGPANEYTGAAFSKTDADGSLVVDDQYGRSCRRAVRSGRPAARSLPALAAPSKGERSTSRRC